MVIQEQWTSETSSLEETEKLGSQVGRLLRAGDVIALIGELGSGKTCLTRGIANGAGIGSAAFVTSPTFVLHQVYPTPIPIHHFDAYRLPSPESFRDLGVDELFEESAICIIEWADRVISVLPEQRLEIRLEVVGETSRRLVFSGIGQRFATLLRLLVEQSEIVGEKT